MCPVVALVASTALQMVGANAEAQGQANQAEYQAQVLDQRAQVAREEGQVAADIERTENRRALARLENRIGHQGVQLGTGSAELTMIGAGRQLEYNARVVEHETEKAALGFSNDASAARASAEGYRSGGRLGVATRLLSGVTQGIQWNQQDILFPDQKTSTNVVPPPRRRPFTVNTRPGGRPVA